MNRAIGEIVSALGRARNVVLLCTCLAAFSQTGPAPVARQVSPREKRQRAEKWLVQGRRVPHESAARLRYRGLAQKLKMRASGRTNAGLSNSAWTPLGPAPLASDASGVGQQDYNWVSGRATAVVVDPADASANTVYLGGAYGGVWKTTNASQIPSAVEWKSVTDDQATLAVGAIAVQPQLSNPDPSKTVVIVGTGEANSSTDSYYGLGILRSADAGDTWSLIPSDGTGTRSFAGMAFSKISFSSSNPNLVVAAAAGASEGLLEGLAANLGLYYSLNAGISWTLANMQDGGVATAAGSVTAVTYNSVDGKFFAALRYHGFYSSADGINWTRLPNQPGTGLTTAVCPAQSNSSACPIGRGEIAVVPGRNEMYVWYVDAYDNDEGIWESINGGATWTQISDEGISNCGDGDGCGTMDASYNLELAAIPDGGATDLYAGAVNVYKCQINYASPDCSGSGSNRFLNLTHAYGCSGIAKVHPAQHSIAFQLLNNNTQVAMYFANDGGIYRALDGFSGLTTGTCGGTNGFDSLNQTLGSLTQFVSFAQSRDGNTILGGTQGNGSPATQSLIGSTTWENVNGGDGSYTAIDPSDGTNWFVSTPPDAVSGVNIFRCQSGVSCHTQDFLDDQVVSSTTLSGDVGAYHAPFLFDPRNSSELIVGTCRMWRGTSTGTGFTAISNNFENGGVGICTGSETNLVRSIASGGPTDPNGLSAVMYAGTSGLGPLMPTIPPGGQVWVSTNVAEGPSSWVDQTGAINPSAFPISGIAMDTSDASGMTAYVSIMGFHVPHVWKTTNGGGSWTDFSGNLPDAPVNAILVDAGSDPQNGMIYVGSDVGVFFSYATSANWTEIGPAPGSGESGFLPNVAVTALNLFDDGTNKWLRASTYGRGMWQSLVSTSPDFLISITNTPMTVFAGSSAVFSGEAFSLNGYSNAVDLSCQPGSSSPPTTCWFDHTVIQPSSSGTPFTLTASGAAAGYHFNVQGVGTDSSSTTRNASVTLNIVDFNLTAPSKPTLTLGPAAVSPPISFQVTAAGPFSDLVDLSCSGLPIGATCSFQPANVVAPTADAAVAVTLTITTAAFTPVSTSTVAISGTVSGGPTRSQSLSLVVTADYAIMIANPSLSAAENASATFNGSLTTQDGYTSAVDVNCGTGGPPTCSVAPSHLMPTIQGAAFTVTVSSGQAQSYRFVISAVGTDEFAVSHEFPVAFTSTGNPQHFSFTISPPSQSESIKAGAAATYQMTIAPCSNCGSFPSAVSLSFAGCPPLSNCAVDPVSVPAGTGSRTVSFTVQTTGAAIVSGYTSSPGGLYALCLGMPLSLIIGGLRGRVCRVQRWALGLTCLAGLLALAIVIACGGGLQGGSSATPQPGTPAGTYYLSITATMNSSPATAPQKADLNLTVGP